MSTITKPTTTKLRIRGIRSYRKCTFCLGVLVISFIVVLLCRFNYFQEASHESNFSDSSTSSQSFATANVESHNQLIISDPKCQNDSVKKRWSDRIVPSSNVQSMFNCDMPDATCRYYFPNNFFDEKCGIGKAYVKHIADAEAMRKNFTLWRDMPSVGFPTLTMDNLCFTTDEKSSKREKSDRKRSKRAKEDRKRRPTHLIGPKVSDYEMKTLNDIGEHFQLESNTRCLTERLSMIHVHKSGGSSLHRSFDKLKNLNQATAKIQRHKWFTPTKENASKRKGISSGDSQIINSTIESLSYVTKYPVVSFGTHNHVMFAVVRDPVERFISSIGQAMGGEGSQRNKIGPTLHTACIKSTSAKTLKCMAKYVQKHGFWIELHFTPQVLDISFTTVWQDIPIAIFSFAELPSILKYLGSPNERQRNGSSPKYRAHSVLTNMTVSDYDDEALQIVCEIYQMDVIMQRSLGIEVPKCDPFIPK